MKQLSLSLLSYTKKLPLIKTGEEEMCCLMASMKYLDELSKTKQKTAPIEVMFRKKSGLTAEKV